ncbi:hypothetical protein TCAL_05582 [Tigriopus californicus]|uniref:Uncharacterized protein n=1 Tax=Tigriopus californicus TaxID=6832 RepID=A0A553NDW7_TIGCA|nr:hypothetical protein TCAL_05582 [Tigriopus californicus]
MNRDANTRKRWLLEAGGARVLPRWEIITPSDVNSADLLLTENAMWQDLSFSRFLSKYQTNLRPISTRFISDCLRMSVVDRREYFIRNPSSIIASHLHCDPVESVKLQRNSSLPLFPNALEMSAPLNPSFTTASVTPKPSSRPKRISRRAKSQSPSEKVPLGLRKSLSLPSGSHQTPPIHPHEIVVATFKDCIDKGALRSHFMDLGGSGFIRKFISHVDDQHQEHFCMDPTYLSTLKTYIAGDSDGPEDTVSLWQEVISFFDISLNSASYYDQRILNPLLLEGLLRQPSAIVQSTVHEFLLKLVNTNQIPNSNPMRMVYLASLSFRSMTNAISFDEEEPWEFVAMISRQAFDSEDSKTGASLVLDFIARIVTIDLHLLETSLPKSGEVSLVQTIFWGTDVKVQSIPKRVVELVQFFVTSLKHHRWDLFKRYNALLSVVARCIVINHCSPDTLHDLARLVSNELQHQFPRDSPEANHQLTIQVLCLMSPNWLSLLTTMYYNDQFPVPLSLDKLIAASNTATDLV